MGYKHDFAMMLGGIQCTIVCQRRKSCEYLTRHTYEYVRMCGNEGGTED